MVERTGTEESLRASEERHRNFINTINDLVFTIDTEGNILFANSLAGKFTGYEPEETIGHNFKEYVHPDDVPKLLTNIELLLNGEPIEPINGIDQDSEYRMVKRDGEIIWVATRARPIKDAQGKITAFSGISREISNRKKAEKALEEIESRLNAAQQIAHIGSWERNIETGEIYWSDELYRIWGYEPGKITPTHELVKSMIHPDDQKKFEEVLEAALYRYELYDNEFRIIHEDGVVSTVHALAKIIRDNTGHPIRIAGTVQDIEERKRFEMLLKKSHDELERRVEERTKKLVLASERLETELENRKRVEKNLRFSEERTQALLNAISDIAILINPEGIVDASNTLTAKRVGIKLDQFIGKCLYDFFPRPLAKSRKSKVSKVISSGKPIRYEDQRNGRITDNNVYPVFNGKGEVIQLAIHAKDITEHVHANETLRKREEELRRKAVSLEETNTALNVLLKKRETDKTELEEKIISNVKELIEPYLIKLKNSRLDWKQQACISVLESGFKEIVSPFLRRFCLKYHNLTPKEIQIAGLIKEGKTTKEIADLQGLTTFAIDFHRKKLREKLNLTNSNGNLQTHLLNIA